MRRSLLSIVSFLILLPLACSSRPSRVVIGVALSPANHPAVELAAREINAAGGIGGIPLELMGLEWKIGAVFNAKEILELANKFADTKDLVAVIGHSDSSFNSFSGGDLQREGSTSDFDYRYEPGYHEHRRLDLQTLYLGRGAGAGACGLLGS